MLSMRAEQVLLLDKYLPALGIMQSKRIRLTSHHAEKGDRMALFTDGI
jgi:hypothetical protein